MSFEEFEKRLEKLFKGTPVSEEQETIDDYSSIRKFVRENTSKEPAFLEIMLEKLAAINFQFSLLCRRDLYLKFRINSSRVLRLISERIDGSLNDTNFKKKLNEVGPDVREILTRKKVDNSIIQKLLIEYGADKDFENFVRGCDIRKRSQTGHYESIKKKFLEFKDKKTIKNYDPRVKLSVGAQDASVLISANEETSRLWAMDTSQKCRISLVVGRFCKGSSTNQILHLPLEFSVKMSNNCISSYVHTSFFVSTFGRILAPTEVSSFFDERTFLFCDIYTLEELSKIVTSEDTVHVESGTNINHGIIARLVRDAKTTTVSSSEALVGLQGALSPRQSTMSIGFTLEKSSRILKNRKNMFRLVHHQL
ncbi:hypothetical protein B9Z55_014464 [Caenorhabditis nigoni]|uniref:Uncharacterized protein n=1 Tax=Caenorhabditis nigoni TaxID=1611254 RepID=A0A2G5U5Z2_9PELO|nr:hypothetical protein B9Z55_014464 [Caenorhabditis nigoni]